MKDPAQNCAGSVAREGGGSSDRGTKDLDQESSVQGTQSRYLLTARKRKRPFQA